MVLALLGARGRMKPRCPRFAFCCLAPQHPGDCEVRPQPGFQERFLACAADGALGGGAVGAGKSAVLLIEPLRWIHLPGFTALLLRKEQRDLERAGGLWQKSLQLYPAFGGSPKQAEYLWTFESGATIQMGYMDPRNYERQHQGPEIGYLGFDELTHFTRAEFLYMLLRLRNPFMPAYWRATCNPDPDSWVRGLVDWWIADSSYRGPVLGYPEMTGGAAGWPRADRAGRARYYLRRDGKEIWGDSPEELLERFPRARREHIKTFAFHPGRLEENRYLAAEYEGNIEEQEEETRARWRGNWNARAEKGKAFKPEWFLLPNGEIRPELLLEEAPADTTWVRPWDLAATAERDAVHGSSYTAGPRMGLFDGLVIFHHDLELGRWDAGEVERRVVAAARRDGKHVKIWFCRERAGAGKSVLERYVRLLHGYDVDGDVESGEKEVRLRPLAAQAKHGHIRFMRDPDGGTRAAQDIIRALLRLPDKPDDLGDAAAAGYQVLAGTEDGEHEVQELAEQGVEMLNQSHEASVRLDTSGAWGLDGW